MRSVCTSCGDKDAYVGFNVVECPNMNCEKFSQKQYDDVYGKASTMMTYETFNNVLEATIPSMQRYGWKRGDPETFYQAPGYGRSRVYRFIGDENACYQQAVDVLFQHFGGPKETHGSTMTWFVPNVGAEGVEVTVALGTSVANVSVVEIDTSIV